MYAESEAICTLIACLQAAGVEDYRIIMNHRQYLDHILASCGVIRNLVRTICSSIDKLDKSSPAAVKAEMKIKGLEDEIIERVFEKVSASSNFADRQIEHPAVAEDLSELEKFLRASRVDLSRLTFDLSLARGLDYYDGLVFEVKAKAQGSIAAGGRYNASFDSEVKNPAIGFSIGLDRLCGCVPSNIA